MARPHRIGSSTLSRRLGNGLSAPGDPNAAPQPSLPTSTTSKSVLFVCWPCCRQLAQHDMVGASFSIESPSSECQQYPGSLCGISTVLHQMVIDGWKGEEVGLLMGVEPIIEGLLYCSQGFAMLCSWNKRP